MPSLTDTLCTRCGLCCDGTLLADVELGGRAEADRLEVIGMEIEDDDSPGGVLPLPCGALRGTRCSIYPYRPAACRAFECDLLQDVRRGAVSVEQAGEHIADMLERTRRVRELLSQLGQRDHRLPLKERCAEALCEGTGDGLDDGRRRAELEAAMTGVERAIRATFLKPSARHAHPSR